MRNGLEVKKKKRKEQRLIHKIKIEVDWLKTNRKKLAYVIDNN